MPAPTIALSMIVKDESHVIERCLATVKPLIDYWVIADTGSTDNTREIITEFLDDVPGELIEIPWQGFAESRNRSLEQARKKADYCLIIDADEVLIFDDTFQVPPLTFDSYNIKTCFDGIEYWRRQLVKSTRNWRYTGRVHELLDLDESYTDTDLLGVINFPQQDSARNSLGLEEKTRRDAKILEEEFAANPDDARTVFMLAQSHMTSENLERAVELYRLRTTMGGDEDAIWFSFYKVGLILERLGGPVNQVIDSYQQAFFVKPHRAEPLVRLISYFITQNDFKTSLELFDLIRYLKCPERDYRVERLVYTGSIPEIASLLDHAESDR